MPVGTVTSILSPAVILESIVRKRLVCTFIVEGLVATVAAEITS